MGSISIYEMTHPSNVTYFIKKLQNVLDDKQITFELGKCIMWA